MISKHSKQLSNDSETMLLNFCIFHFGCMVNILHNLLNKKINFYLQLYHSSFLLWKGYSQRKSALASNYHIWLQERRNIFARQPFSPSNDNPHPKTDMCPDALFIGFDYCKVTTSSTTNWRS